MLKKMSSSRMSGKEVKRAKPVALARALAVMSLSGVPSEMTPW